MNNKKVTIEDVADKAGVSPSTVSRVLNRKAGRHMKEETKKKVEEAIKELGYTPDKYAQAMRHKETKVIGVLIPDVSNPFFASLVWGIEDKASEKGYSTIICNSQNNPNREEELVETLIKEKVDGAIFTPCGDDSRAVYELTDEEIDVVFADRKLKETEFPIVTASYFEGSYELTSQLLDNGLERIAYVRGPVNISSVEERFQGYRHAMRDNGVSIEPGLIQEVDTSRKIDYQYENVSLDAGFEIAEEYLGLAELPDAILASNDVIAVGIIKALREGGVKVPGEVPVCGYDNIPLASYVDPSLTTIDVPTAKMGEMATEMLLNRLGKSRADKPVENVSTDLIYRDSCPK